jgi:hypothetical protein
MSFLRHFFSLQLKSGVGSVLQNSSLSEARDLGGPQSRLILIDQSSNNLHYPKLAGGHGGGRDGLIVPVPLVGVHLEISAAGGRRPSLQRMPHRKSWVWTFVMGKPPKIRHFSIVLEFRRSTFLKEHRLECGRCCQTTLDALNGRAI